MRLELNAADVWCTVHGTSEEIDGLESTLEWLMNQLGSNVCYPTWVRRGAGQVSILSGIVPLLAADQGWALPIVVAGGSREVFYEPWFRDWLWPHQQEAVKAALLAPAGRGVLEVPTGGGKTRIAAALGTCGAAFGGDQWLYVAPNHELLVQCRGTFLEGAAAAGGRSVHWTFATYAGLGDLPIGAEYDGVVFDECHRIAARTWALGASGVRACWRIGLSGTPLDRTDSKNSLVIGLCGPVVYTVSLETLQEAGRLAKSTVEIIEVNHD